MTANGAKQLGLHLTLAAHTPAGDPNLARMAEENGYSSVWLAEAGGADAIVSMAAYATGTSRIQLSTGVVPIQIRTPVTTATAFLTLNEISGGRAIAGIGVSSPIIVERWHGASYRKPVTAMREYVTIMRQIFTEGRVRFDGEVFRSDFRLGFRPSFPPPKIFLAALNPPMLRLAGEVADGVLFNYSPPEAIEEMLTHVHTGAQSAGRQIEEIEIAIYIRMCITAEERTAIDAFKRELAGYSFVGSYNRMFERYGLGEEFAEVRRLWKEGRRDEAPNAISDASARKLAAFGPPEAGRDLIARFRSAGISLPIVFPVGPSRSAQADFIATMKAMVAA
jgi:probable F420-dependent oxidoreductase